MDRSKSPNIATVVSARKMAKGKLQRRAHKVLDKEEKLKKVIIGCLLKENYLNVRKHIHNSVGFMPSVDLFPNGNCPPSLPT